MNVTQLLATRGAQSDLIDVAAFDCAPREAAAALLRPCCASSRWIRELALGRPFGSRRALLRASDDIISDLGRADVAEALAGFASEVSELAGEGDLLRGQWAAIVRLRLIMTFR